MPLCKSIPLCSFTYTGDTLSSATFKYDTKEDIVKESAKLLYAEESCFINKGKNKSLYSGTHHLGKKSNLSLYKEEVKINKQNQGIHLTRGVANIDKSQDKTLVIGDLRGINLIEYFNLVNDSINKYNITLNDKKLLNNLLPITITLSNYSHLTACDINTLNIDNIKNLNSRLYRELSLINSTLNLNTPTLKEANIMSTPYMEIQRGFDLGKLSEKTLVTDFIPFISKYFNEYYDKIIDKQILIPYQKYVGKNNNKDIITNQKRLLYRKSDNVNINVNINNDIFLKSINIKDTLLTNSHKLLYKQNSNILNKPSSLNYLDRIAFNLLDKMNNVKGFYKHSIKNISTFNPCNYLGKVSLKSIFEINDLNYLERLGIITTFKLEESYLKRDSIINTFSIKAMYLKYLPLLPIYKQGGKSLLDVTIYPVYKEFSKLLKDISIDPIYKNNFKFIEVTKRWWWLKESNPGDKLIVPNRDYDKMSELLSNNKFEYLRYSNHPIDWGKNLGIDWNIPPHAVSVEIMLDLINILIMIWHHNVQAWLNCTGKEGIQFIMELLYDWYSLNTSRPNASYKRAYRWIRWEAEKVYFLNTTSGLQSIGILIANLIDYMKFHHFNLIPLWGNPKAMDTERNFNRIATHDDLMKELDKLKGNRHYFIEAQKIERQNITRR